MIVHGEGGTGKSRVIQTIMQMFEKSRAASMLLKSAYTGIAASLIDRKTLHSIGHISIHQSFHYLIIDECSMISRSFLAELWRFEYPSVWRLLPIPTCRCTKRWPIHACSTWC
ncbi:hypothetical protein DFJ43DRAFT_1078069 [Lentinula guzmanii]|uniref:ATP-dependent DNA helicase n=1 Tax=Lentinula guzmanii TaxID=2804957 RepID=A0AA38MZ34_9AGAR|nr:hypothetical protein DFJ43DRAFT_1078069 [Lentinula guzmanii]